MISSEYTPGLFRRDSDARILMLVVDGLGGLPRPTTGKTELETASLQNLDELAASGSCGLISPLGPGLTPGSGPAHLALFGYDPWRLQIGRGALSALGLDLDFGVGDVAARLNFCCVDGEGRVTDRRAGRITTEKCTELCRRLAPIEVPDVSIQVAPEMDYRATVIFRGEGLGDEVGDSDPQVTGVAPRILESRTESGGRTRVVADAFLSKAADILADEPVANMIIMRGFGSYPRVPQMSDVYGLRSAAVAAYPMYRGVARAVGMDIVPGGGAHSMARQVIADRWHDYDFFYVHIKKTDSAGEDGDFDSKVDLLEEVDDLVGSLRELAPEVLIVTGDHSTPSTMGAHSWHPVPLLISSKWSIPTAEANSFTERSCLKGSIGQVASSSLMALALAHARRLSKFGA